MKRTFLIIIGLILISILAYKVNPRVKFYTHYGIWLPSFCENFNFNENPDFMALLGLEGDGASADFEIEKENIEILIKSINPQDLWLRYSEFDSTMIDVTLNDFKGLPEEVLNGQIKVMLWSSDTKGDYYNIWLIPIENGRIKVNIRVPFT
jgi:hypothetical protein